MLKLSQIDANSLMIGKSYREDGIRETNFIYSSLGGGGYGQNIDSVGMVAGKDWSSSQKAKIDADTKAWDKVKVLGQAISNSWYGPEEPNYAKVYNAYGKDNPGTEVPGAQILHFTQIVWKDTTKVGCATAYCGDSLGAPLGGVMAGYNWFTVCNYASPGKSLTLLLVVNAYIVR